MLEEKTVKERRNFLTLLMNGEFDTELNIIEEAAHAGIDVYKRQPRVRRTCAYLCLLKRTGQRSTDPYSSRAEERSGKTVPEACLLYTSDLIRTFIFNE